jgi:outer membrane lipoprotein SlyB
MKILSLVVATALAGGCYSESTTSRTWSAEPTAGPAYGQTQMGRVVQIQEVTRERRGRPAAGAAAGALLGGAVFHSWGAAAVGGGIGALASSGRSAQRVVEVTVQFDNGERGVFDYRDWAPFRPGQRVLATPNGLQSA